MAHPNAAGPFIVASHPPGERIVLYKYRPMEGPHVPLNVPQIALGGNPKYVQEQGGDLLDARQQSQGFATPARRTTHRPRW
jgi:hypothetical protein